MRMRTAEEMQALRKQVLWLRDEHGMSFADIAERLGLGNRGRAGNVYREALSAALSTSLKEQERT